MTETLANRRVFRSKLDTIRPTYGFEDVSLAPGTDTVDPADVVLAQSFCGIDLEIPVLAAAMDAVADVRLSGELARLGGLVVPQPRGRPGSVRRPVRGPRADRRRARRPGPGRPRRGLRAADPRGADRPPDRRAPCRGLEGRRVRDAGRRAPVRPVLRRARRGPVPRPVAGLLGPSPRDRLRAPGPRGLHAVHADPGRGRQHDQRAGRVHAHGAGRGGDLRRRRAGRRVHDPRGPRHRCAAGQRHRGRRGRARPAPRRDRPVRARRGGRRHEAGRRRGEGARGGRGRGDARIAAGPGRRGARPRHELGDGGPVAGPARAGRGSRSGPSGRWNRSSTAHRMSPTARRT